MELQDLVRSIGRFDSWSHAEKIRFFAWFIHSQRGKDRFNAADIKSCYDGLHIEEPSNISPFLSQMEKRKPKEAIKDSRGYYLARHVRDALADKYDQRSVDPRPKTEQVLPQSVVNDTRSYIERIIQQANGCYEHGWFDGCMVMVRKFVEILIIEVYEAHGKTAEIKDRNSDFLMLRDLVTTILNDSWNLSRDTKRALPEIKSYGDRSAHNRRYLAHKADVDKLIPGLRVVADDLLHLAKLK